MKKRKIPRAWPKPKKIKEGELLKLDLGCGKNVREGFTGVDIKDFGQPIKADLTKTWPWKDGSVDEVWCSHMIEHFTPEERIHFVNELYRVLKPGATCQLIAPHWASCRAYGDMTHKWPPLSEFWFYYLSKEWRAKEAPHETRYECDFACQWGYSLHPSLVSRNQEYQTNAVTWWKDAAQDIICNMKKI